MRENRTPGSARGLVGNGQSYLNGGEKKNWPQCLRGVIIHLFMTAEEIKRLPTEEKFLIMETLWDDLRDHFETAEIPESHKDLLRSRRLRVQSGESKLLDWDDVKSSIGRP